MFQTSRDASRDATARMRAAPAAPRPLPTVSGSGTLGCKPFSETRREGHAALPQRDPNYAERKIYFHKAVNDADPDFELDREEVVERISALAGTADFYINEGDEQYLCAVVDRPSPPQRVRFYRVRRRNLPETEEAGSFEDLDLAEQKGLAESIHILLFDDNVIGSEYNHYGPRITTFGYFLGERCGQDVVLRPFIRGDVMSAILGMQEIRRLRVKATPHGVAELQQAGVALSEGFEAADIFRAGKYVDLTLAASPGDPDFTDRVKRFFRGLRDSNIEPSGVLQDAEVYGVTSDDGLGSLSLLNDRVVIVEQIRKESQRHRTLDTQAAYAAIESVRTNLADDLARGGTLRVEQR